MAPQTFKVFLEKAPTADTVIHQVVAGAHEQLAAACAGQPSASVRIWNPLSSGGYADVSCAEILNGEAATGEAREALMSERIAEARQKLTPIGLGCSILMGALSLLFTHYDNVGCNTPNAVDAKTCRNVTNYGFITLGIACTFI